MGARRQRRHPLLYNAISGEVIAHADSSGVDLESAYVYGREVGGPALRSMTFQQRGRMLKRLALHLHAMKEEFYQRQLGHWGHASRLMD